MYTHTHTHTYSMGGHLSVLGEVLRPDQLLWDSLPSLQEKRRGEDRGSAQDRLPLEMSTTKKWACFCIFGAKLTFFLSVVSTVALSCSWEIGRASCRERV